MHFRLCKVAAVQVASLLIHSHHITAGISYVPRRFTIYCFAYPVTAGIVSVCYRTTAFRYAQYFSIHTPGNIGNSLRAVFYEVTDRIIPIIIS